MKLIPSPPDESISHDPSILKKVFIRYGDLGPITQFAQATFLPGQLAPAHAHTDMAEVFHVSQGTATIVLNGVPIYLEKGQTLIVHPHEEHEVSNQENEPLILTYFGLKTDTSSDDQ